MSFCLKIKINKIEGCVSIDDLETAEKGLKYHFDHIILSDKHREFVAKVKEDKAKEGY